MDGRELRAVIFDMDGLIFDSERIAQFAWEDAARESGYDLSNDIFRVMVGRMVLDVADEIYKALGEDFPLEVVYQRKNTLAEEYIIDHGLPLKQGLMELLGTLDRLDLHTAIASSSSCEIILRNLRAAGLSQERFSALVGGDEVQNRKPAPDIFLVAAQALRVPPDTCMVLEDSNPGVKAAHAAGMLPIMVPDIVPPTERSRALAYRVVPSLYEVIELLGE